MKPKTLILMGVAVVCGLAASWLTRQYLVAQEKKVKILVAKVKMRAYTPLLKPEELFEEQERPQNEVSRSTVGSFDELKDSLLTRPLEAGTPVTKEDLQDKSKVGLEGVIQKGHRAVGIRTTAETVAGGFVQPMSHVDILASKRTEKGADCKVILQNILVRGVDQKPTRPEDTPGIVPATVTVELTPDQMVVLEEAKAEGAQISLALRGLNDGDMVGETSLYAKKPEPKKVVEEPKKVVAEAPKVELPKVVKKSVMMIYNGPQWIKATYSTKSNGELETNIEKSESSVGPAPAPTAPVPAPVIQPTPSEFAPVPGTTIPGTGVPAQPTFPRLPSTIRN